MGLNDSEYILNTFEQLTAEDLYQVMRLRAAVFVLEQNCAYQDMDDADQQALHLFKKSENDQIIAYARILTPSQCQSNNCSIGRVVVKKNMRHLKLGKSLMQTAIKVCLDNFPQNPIQISAQTYLTGFYQNLGFINTGHYYLEDDIPHQAMIYKP